MGQDEEMNRTHADAFHTPVMLEEVVALFTPISHGVIVDTTFGGGGHTAALLEHLDSDITVLGIDRDPQAIRTERPHPRLRLINRNYQELDRIMAQEGIEELAGVLFDLGVSSHQLDERQRGFSYRNDGPLDMRMGPDADQTADDLVNRTTRKDLARIIRVFGEERFADRIARAIVESRPITGTSRLADVVRGAIPAATRRTGPHPARRTFQALRIAVNAELEGLSRGLNLGLQALRPGGRCVTIAYHSLEDRIIKRRIRRGEGRHPGPVLPVPPTVDLKSLTRKPLRPTPEEVSRNPRARSARLRAVEKLA